MTIAAPVSLVRCHVSGKLSYASRRRALEAGHKVGRALSLAYTLHAYRCPACRYWHITKQPRRAAGAP